MQFYLISVKMEASGKDTHIMIEKIDGRTFYCCGVCKKKLSSKRNAQYHLHSAHEMSKY